MPYIVQEMRNELDPLLEPLLARLRGASDEILDGAVSYILARMVDDLYGSGGFYAQNRAVGVLDNAKDEFRRRRLHPHEDRKKLENGEVYKLRRKP